MGEAIKQAQAAGKRLIAEEWGSLVGPGRIANLEDNACKLNKWKVPWIYWQLITNIDPHEGEDYEVLLALLIKLSLTDYRNFRDPSQRIRLGVNS